MVKSAQYMIVVHQASGVEVRIGLKLDHGPTPEIFAPHSVPIAVADPGTLPALMVGDAGTAIIGEFLRPVLKVDSNDANEQWAVVTIYEMRKPF